MQREFILPRFYYQINQALFFLRNTRQLSILRLSLPPNQNVLKWKLVSSTNFPPLISMLLEVLEYQSDDYKWFSNPNTANDATKKCAF